MFLFIFCVNVQFRDANSANYSNLLYKTVKGFDYPDGMLPFSIGVVETIFYELSIIRIYIISVDIYQYTD